MNEWVGRFGLEDCGGEIFFFGRCNVIGNMDGSSGGWKDICIYLYLKRGFNSSSFEC